MDKQGYEEMIAVLTRVINKQQVTTWGLCSELKEFKRKAERATNVDAGLWLYFIDRIAKAKMKLNHYKQLLGNLTAAEQLYKKTEHLFRKQEFKVGDKVKVVSGKWQRCSSYLDFLYEYIGVEGVVVEVYISPSADRYSYFVRTTLDVNDEGIPDEVVYNFPPEALELIP